MANNLQGFDEDMPPMKQELGGGWTNPSQKLLLKVKLGHFPNFRGENKK